MAFVSEYYVDVGAGNKEAYREWLHNDTGLQIRAIEPHPTLAARLRDGFADEKVSKRVFVHELACVAIPAKTATLWCCNQLSCSSTLPLSEQGPRQWKYPAGAQRLALTGPPLSVAALTLSQFFEDMGFRRDVGIRINIDVQGDALNVLKGISPSDMLRVREITVKAHLDSAPELYVGQTRASAVTELLVQTHKFVLKEERSISRGQECIIRYVMPQDSATTNKKLPTKPKISVAALMIPQKKLLGGIRRMPTSK